MRTADESVQCGRSHLRMNQSRNRVRWKTDDGHIWACVVTRCSNLLSLRRHMLCAISKFNRGTLTNSCVVRTVGDLPKILIVLWCFIWSFVCSWHKRFNWSLLCDWFDSFNSPHFVKQIVLAIWWDEHTILVCRGKISNLCVGWLWQC